MAATFTKVFSRPIPVGDRWMNVGTIALDNSYPTGGYPMTPATFGFAPTSDPEFHCEVKPSAGYVFEYDHTNQKVKAFQGDNTNAASAPGVEVGNATNLSAITAVRVVAYGRFPK